MILLTIYYDERTDFYFIFFFNIITYLNYGSSSTTPAYILYMYIKLSLINTLAQDAFSVELFEGDCNETAVPLMLLRTLPVTSTCPYGEKSTFVMNRLPG